MKKFYLKNTLYGQFCFNPPNRLFHIGNQERGCKQSTIEELDKCSQNNLWPSVEKRIEQIQLKLTNKCNYSCIHCLENASPKNDVFLDFNLLMPLIKDFVQQNKNGNIVLTGGEPLLHPDIYQIVVKISELHLPITLYSNGAILVSDRFDDSLLKYFQHVQLSIDGFCEHINDSIRGKGAFKTIIKALAILNKKNIPTTLSCTLFEHNITDVEDNIHSFIDLYYNDNITLNFDYARPLGRGKMIAPSFEKGLEYQVRIKKILDSYLLEKEIPQLNYCGYGRALTVDSYGNTYACTHSNSFIGNYPTFQKVLKKIQQEIDFMENRAKKICKNCVLAWPCAGGCFLENRNSCDLKRKNMALLRMAYGMVGE